MKITRENYETWFLDYLEGRLDKQGEEAVGLFLEQHPDLKDELESFSPALLMDRGIGFPGKERLKKSELDDPLLFEQAAIAHMEGDLSGEEAASFRKWLDGHPEKREFTDRMARTRLQPDPGLTFPGRDRLKKKNRVPVMLIRFVAVAASLLLAFFLFLPSERNPGPAAITTTATSPPEMQGNRQVADLPRKEEPHRIAPEHPVAAAVSTQKRTSALPETETVVREAEPRSFEPVQPLAARPVTLVADLPAYDDLVPVRVFGQVYYASGEIPLSEYLNIKLQALKSDGPKGFFSREEVTVAGLRLFSRLPGKHLTGKKGNDGKLKSISFNTQALAFSIPVNQ